MAVDLAAFALVLVAIVLLPHPSLQLLAGALAGLVIGRLVSMPSLTPYSLWDLGHNVVHHGYTDLKDFDFVWQPLPLGGSGWSTCTGAAGRQGCITRWKSGGSACTFRPGN